MESTEKIIARLLAKSERDPESGCLRWTGALSPKGYGSISVHGRARAVHRVAHEVWVGPIPDGLEIDHVHARGCRYRDCIEPDHLEAITHAENLSRRTKPTRVRGTHCKRGHRYTEANTYWRVDAEGYRFRRCRICVQAEQSARRACSHCGKQIRVGNFAAHQTRMHQDESRRSK